MAVCRNCGAELDPDGTCAICMLAGGLGTKLAAMTGSGGTKIEVAVRVEPAEALEEDSFGSYCILSMLGEGGMGAVYLAEQTHPLHRQVALKVVKRGLNSSQILSRFNYERQAVAMMDHPNIARVYDAGASDKGRPYFVMEYVDGLPITEYCDQHRLNTGERLELFVCVCHALQHAHQKGVIHRDIKASNVLVTQVDGQAVPKVIDFGIARATEAWAVGNAAFTQLGQFVGTPEYMSPEQTDLVTGDIDTSSDVYSLGVLLYELLIGAVPFEAERLRKAGLTELLRIIREEEAMPMAAKLAEMGDAVGEVAARRRTDPPTLRRLVHGDLNWIVTKALEKDRRRRYSTAFELATDIRRHLDDQPVSASPPSTLYLAGKFVRRHRAPVIAAAAVLIALIAGIVATTWQATIAQRERAEAEARLNDVHGLADPMLFEISDDVKDLPGGTKAREALVRLGEQYLNKEAAVTERDPARRSKLAEAFLKLGDLEGEPGESNLRDLSGARQSYGRSRAILEPEVASHPQDAHLRHLLTLVYVRQARLEESTSSAKAFGSVLPTFVQSWGQLDESAWAAKPILERAANSAEIYIKQWPGDPQGLRDRCEVLEAKGEFAAAVELRQRILARSPNDPTLRWELAHAELALGSSLVLKNRLEALRWLQKGADSCQALGKADPANVQYQRDRAVALGSMTRVLLNVSRLDDAVADARQSVSILENLTASDPRNASFRLDLSAARVALSNAYYDNGQPEQALQNVALAASVQEEQAARNPDNPDFPLQAAYNYRNAGRYKGYLKDFKGALEQYRKAEAIDRKLLARYPGRFELSEALRGDLDSVGDAFLGLDDPSSALRAYRAALAIANEAAGVHPTPRSLVSEAMAQQGVSSGLRAISQWAEAITEQRAAIAIWQGRVAGEPNSQGIQHALSRSEEQLARLYEGNGDYAAGVAAAEKALPFLEADYSAHPDDVGAKIELRNARLCLRVEYLRAADFDRAVAVARQVFDMMNVNGVINRATSSRDFGDTLLRSGRRQESLAAFRHAASILDKSDTSGPNHINPIEKEPSLLYRNELALTFLSIAAEFTAARREEESTAILKRIVPVLEAMVRDHPGNDLYRDTLLQAYRTAALAFLGLGDLARSLHFDEKALQLQQVSALTPISTRAACDRALLLARTGSLQLRLGSRKAAQRTWREALDGFEKAARDSEQEWSADKENLNALETLKLARSGADITQENLDGRSPTLRLLETGYERAESLLRSDSRNGGNRARSDAGRANGVRGLLTNFGDGADNRYSIESGNPAGAQILALAQRWRNRADAMESFDSPIASRLEAVGKALELSRHLVAVRPSTANRLGLAGSLRSQGDAFRTAARCSKGAASTSSYQRSRDDYLEALGILTSLKRSGQLSTAGEADFMTLMNDLTDTRERLQQELSYRPSSSEAEPAR